MNREEAIKHLKAARLMLLGPDNQPINDLYVALSEGIEALNAAPRWVRVEERLPKKQGKYLVCWNDSGGFCYDTAWWTSVGTWSLAHWTGVTVTHWMPIEPPKE